MLKAAFYEKEITPPLGCFLPGYFNLRQGSDVKDRLYVKAMVVQNDTDTAAFISVDGCLVEESLRDIIVERIKKFTGIKPQNVVFGYIHTHTGIPRSDYKGDLDAEQNQEGYHSVFTKLAADCVTLAYYRLEECQLSFAKGRVDGISFCRDYKMKNSTPQTNPGILNPDIEGPAAEIDRSLPVLFVKDKAGRLMGSVTCFDCHLDCVDGTAYSGDFASELAAQMKKAYGRDFVSLFFMGTAGNVNHFNVKKPITDPFHYRYMGKLIFDEVCRIYKEEKAVCGEEILGKLQKIKLKRKEISSEQLESAKHIIATVKEIPNVKIAADNTDPDQYNLAMAKSLMKFVNETPEVMDIMVQTIKIGDFTLFAFPGEIFSKFGFMVKEAAQTDKFMVTTMCNQSPGYVVTPDLVYDTIYESRPGANRLETGAGQKMAEALIEMGK